MTEDNDRRQADMTAARQDPQPGQSATRVKVWTGLGTILLAGAALSLVPHGSGASPLGKLAKAGAGTSSLVQIAAGHEGGEGGEGGEGAKSANPDIDDAGYLTQLGLMRGHLEVGMELYRQGERKAAEPHMKHPIEELYEPIEPALEKRGAPSFEDKLEALAKLSSNGAPVDQVEAACQDALAGIAAAEAVTPETKQPDLKTRFKVIVDLVRTAASEYDAGVDDKGNVVQPVEYQDALGFVRVAEAMLEAIPADQRARAADAIAKAKAQFETLGGLWPSLVPPDVVKGDPSQLFGAAAYIEIASLHVE
jgi:hypothetical protein